VAPTVAAILGVPLPTAEGRPLLEALAAGDASTAEYAIEERVLRPARAADAGPGLPPFSFEVRAKVLRRGERADVYEEELRRVADAGR
jgi:hypothetical protein